MIRASRMAVCASTRVAVRRLATALRLRATEAALRLSAAGLGAGRTAENNLKTDTNRLSKTLSKFWEKVDTVHNKSTGQHEVRLDGKTLRTPLGFPLAVPESKKQLAHLVQYEWSNLPDLNIKTNAMPLTSLVARAIDLQGARDLHSDELEAKVGRIEDIRLDLLRYLDTDTCLIFTTHDECDGALRRRQDEAYVPLVREYNDFFTSWAQKGGVVPEGHKVELSFLDCETDGLRGNRQAAATQAVALAWLGELLAYELVAFEKAVLTTKSFLCAATLLRSNVGDAGRMRVLQPNKRSADDYFFRSLEQIVELGNMETIFQTRQWGEVEDTHDVDKADWLRSLAAAALVCH